MTWKKLKIILISLLLCYQCHQTTKPAEIDRKGHILHPSLRKKHFQPIFMKKQEGDHKFAHQQIKSIWCFFNNKYQQISETYSEPCQTSKIVRSACTHWPFLQNAPSYMFDRVLNTPLSILNRRYHQHERVSPTLLYWTLQFEYCRTKAKSVSLHYNTRYSAIKAY